MQQKNERAIGRRKFLRAIGSAPVAAAAASAIVPTPAQAYDPGKHETKALYRESDHVKAFYRTNGYETLKKK
jgi:hypothetical protein